MTSASSTGTKPVERHARRRTFTASFKKGLRRVFGLAKPVGQQLTLSDETDPPLSPLPIACNETPVNNFVHEYVEDRDGIVSEVVGAIDDPHSSPLLIPRISVASVSAHPNHASQVGQVRRWPTLSLLASLDIRNPDLLSKSTGI